MDLNPLYYFLGVTIMKKTLLILAVAFFVVSPAQASSKQKDPSVHQATVPVNMSFCEYFLNLIN